MQSLNMGISYPLTAISEQDQITDLNAQLQRGNHKSAKTNIIMVRNAMQDEVRRGWQLIIPLDSVTCIKGAIMSPLGIV